MAAASSVPVDLASSEGGEAKPHVLKPLEELTDADIRQLTREDCRRYLKERGMRRPSWNKAQAIQQVLSLRSLMCSPAKSAASKPDANVQEEAENAPQTKQLLDKVSQQSMPHSSTANNTSDHPRPAAAPGVQHSFLNTLRPTIQKPHRAQLTIFYSGVVKVYEDIPLEKAHAIMLMASSKPFQVPAAGTTNPTPSASTTSLMLPPGAQAQAQAQQVVNHHVYAPALVPPLFPSEALHNSLHEESTDSGLPQARTISLQRFLAKRRERISANPSFYRRCEKQPGTSNKRSKPSSSPPPPFPLPRTAATPPVLSTTSNNKKKIHNHHKTNCNSQPDLPSSNNNSNSSSRRNNKSDISSASSSDNITTAATREILKSNNYFNSRRNLIGGNF